ncbi:MAG: M56 family peptidase [Alistipes senegalensis]|nr:M56 family peptidase [Bacteroides cellulosilyticus]MCM1352174.1 M56 family peptidase [Alistipes senegalensis]
MYELAIYSLKVGACLAVFYLFFKLLLSRETFHRFNRAVVLGAMSLSFVLPLCVITVTHELPAVPETFWNDIPVTITEHETVPTDEPFAWDKAIGALYLLGVLGMLGATLVSIRRVVRLVRSGRREPLGGGVTLVRLQQPVTPFSWWRYIVISEADYAACGHEIITHERAHLRLHHSWDLLLTDFAGCLQWFNPAMWLLRRELRAIHEYEADEAVLDSGVDARRYQILLIKKAAGGRWYSVANSFNHSKLKNRITMMLQKRSSRWAGAKALFVVPLAGLALGAFAETVYVLPQDKGTQKIAEMQISEPSDSSSISVSADKILIKGVDGTKVQEQPLYLIDGKEIADLNDVNALIPERIKTITVLKDVSAAPYIEKYGDKAKNGVILITLKKPGEPDNVAPADVKNMDDVVVVGYGAFPKPEEWEAQQKKFAEMDAYFQSDEWKSKLKQLEKIDAYFQSDEWKAQEKKFAEMDEYFQSDEWQKKMKKLQRDSTALTNYFRSDEWKTCEQALKATADYFQSDEWKTCEKALEETLKMTDDYFQSDEWKSVQKKLEKVDAYFQSDEWKSKEKKLKTIGTVSSVTVGAPDGSQIVYYIDGRLSNKTELNALDQNSIASININKDKQPDGTVLSTIAVTTKGRGVQVVKVGADIDKTVMPVLACEGSPLDISTVGRTRIYSGKFRFTSLKNLPQGATILLNGKEVSRQQLVGKKLRQARFYMGDAAAERGNPAGFLHCSRK